jgi:uncharacterized protein YbjT (DUF2867 family)
VLEEVRRTGKAFRAMYRNEADATQAPAGTASVVADFADRQSLRRALAGVDTVFLVCSPIPQLVELEGNMIDVCVEQGVQHVVLNSALGAEDYPKSFPSWHRRVEDRLKATRLRHTILRPNSFMQNILVSSAPSMRAQGAFYAAMGNAKMSVIHVQDVGVVAAKALVTPEAHAGKTYELNGPESLSQAEIAEKISRIIGRPVRFVDIPEDAQRKAMLDGGMPEWLVGALLDLQQYYTRLGKGAEVTDVLPRLLGRAPITLDQFLEMNRESFRSQAAGA